MNAIPSSPATAESSWVRRQRIPRWLWPLGAALAIGLLAVVSPHPLIPAGLALLVVLTGAFVAAPRAVILFFFLARASLDVTRDNVSLYISEAVQVTPAFFLTLLLIVFGLGYLLVHRVRVPELPLVPWLLLFGGIALVQIPFCRDKAFGLMEWMRFFSAFLIFVLIFDLFRDERSILLLVRVILWSALVPVLAGFYQVASDAGQYITGFVRAYGTFSHPNPYAFFLIIILALLLNLYLTAPEIGFRGKKIFLLGTIPVAACIFFTYTRTAWIGIFILIFLIFLFRQKKFLWVLIIPALILILASPLKERLQDLGTSFNSIIHRFYIWTEGLENLPDYPLLGRGLGSFELMDEYGEPAHNDLLRLLVELGVLGALAYLALAGALIRRLWNCVRRDLGPLGNALSCAVFSATAVLALASLTGNIIFRPVLMWYFWALTAAVLQLDRLKSSPR